MSTRLCPLLFATIAISPIPASASDAAEITELRRQVKALTRSVEQLQQQVNRQRLAPVFMPPHAAENQTIPPSHRRAEDDHDHDHDHDRGTPHESPTRGFHLGIGIAVDAIGSYSRQADNLNFIVRDAEINIEAKIDDFVRAYLSLNAGTELEATERTDSWETAALRFEEAALETTALPAGLSLKAGQFFADFTRTGRIHSHDLPFVDRPASLEQIIGGETRARGVEIGWTPPFARGVHFSAGAVDDIGAEQSITRTLTTLDGDDEETSLFRRSDRRTFDEVLYYGRAETSLELSPSADLDLGVNYARGQDEGTRQIAGGDFRFAWRPNPEGEQRFLLSGEYVWARSHGAFSEEAIFPLGPFAGSASAHGGYVAARYRLNRQWEPGVRFDFLHADRWATRDDDSDGAADGLLQSSRSLQTFSAFITYYLGDVNRLRLQANYLRGDAPDLGTALDDWQLFLQWTIEFGSHNHGRDH